MTALDPKAAAEAIRPAWKKDPPPAMDPQEQHSLSYLEEVCKFLDVEATPINVAHIAKLMASMDIEQHHPDDYPKMPPPVKNVDTGKFEPMRYPADDPRAGQDVIFMDEDEEKEFGNTKPEPVPAPPKPVTAPIPAPIV